ncbi:MAG: hypothetical protein AAGK04_04860, partial [Planctomycetota bacterium]
FAPKDDELVRRRIEAAYAAGDDAAVVSLSRELVKLDPLDETALLRVISANLSKLQTVDQRLVAYRRLLETPAMSISAAVRSRLALDAALLQREVGNTQGFAQLLGVAVTLDPTHKNAASLALNFFQERRPGEVVQEMELLMNLMLCDPLDPQSHIRLYRRAAEAGAYQSASRFQQTAKLILQRSGITDTSDLDVDGLALAWRGQGAGSVAEALTSRISLQREAAAEAIRRREAQELPTDDLTSPEETRLDFSQELFRLLAAQAAGNDEVLAASAPEYIRLTAEAQEALTEALQEPDANRQAILVEGLAQIMERFALQALSGYQAESLAEQFTSLESTPSIPRQAIGVLRGFERLAVGEVEQAIEAFESSPRGLPQLRPLGLIEAYVRAGRNQEAADWALRLERSQPLSVFGSWAWSKRRQALGDQIPVDAQVEAIERVLLSWPRWLVEVFDGPHRFMYAEIQPTSRQIGPLGGARMRIELRNISTTPMAVGADRTFNAKVLMTLGVNAGLGDLSDLTTPEVMYLDRRLTLGPRESVVVEFWADEGFAGWVAETAADEIVRHRSRLIQGFRVGTTTLYEPGPFSLSANSNSVVRLRLPEAALEPEELAQRARNAPAARLPWVAAAVRAGLYKLGEGLELDSRQARPVIEAIAERYADIDDRATRAALLCIMPHARQFPVMQVFDEAARQEMDPALRLVAMATRASGEDDGMLGDAALEERSPVLRRFALLLAERLNAGAPSYSTAPADPQVLRGGSISDP